MFKKLLIIALILLSSPYISNAQNNNFCSQKERYYQIILSEISRGNTSLLDNLPECFKQDRNLIMKILMINPNLFQFASEIIHQDKIFIQRAIKIDSEILRFVAPEVKSDENFMENAIYINRDSLKYCSWSLLDNKLFMKRMIDLDSENYQYASDRIKSMADFVIPVLSDNGSQLEFSPPNVKANIDMIKLAIKSDRKALSFANPQLAKNEELIKLATNDSPFNIVNFNEFIAKNYISIHPKKNLGKFFDNKGKFFSKNKIIDRNFIAKWHKKDSIENNQYSQMDEVWSIVSIENRNFQSRWKDDFKNYPDLIKKIEKFFVKRKISAEIIDELRVNYLWKIKDNPQTIAFNLYSLSPSTDDLLSNNFVNVTSITAIAQKQGDKWQLSMIDIIFNRELKVDPVFSAGHKKYILWDLYKNNINDNNPKIIFKVEDAVNDYLEIFEEQINGKYRSIYKSHPISKL